MRRFEDLLALAAQHHGSPDQVLEKASNDHLAPDMRALPDRHYFAEMTRAVFNAGFNWTVIRDKWDGFEAAFEGFDPHRVAFFSDDDVHRLVQDPRIVRNGQKIQATVQNAALVVDRIKAHGSFGGFLADWPAEDQAGLLAYLGQHGSRLGGATAQYFLRFSGYDAWITSKDVCAALAREGVLDKPQASSKTALRKVDASFTQWHAESGQPRSVISRVLALSTG